jgi:hypothetical protein
MTALIIFIVLFVQFEQLYDFTYKIAFEPLLEKLELWITKPLFYQLEAEEYIGERRLQIIDRRWTGSARDQARTLEDTGTTVEDLDSLGEYEMPTYRRAPGDDRSPQRATAPTDPGDSR